MGILDSGSKVVVMQKCVWEERGLPLHSDHVLWMMSANTSVDSTIGVLEYLALDFVQEKYYSRIRLWATLTSTCSWGDHFIVS